MDKKQNYSNNIALNIDVYGLYKQEELNKPYIIDDEKDYSQSKYIFKFMLLIHGLPTDPSLKRTILLMSFPSYQEARQS